MSTEMTTQTRETGQERELAAQQLLRELRLFVNLDEKRLKELFVLRGETIPHGERSTRAQAAIDNAKAFLEPARKLLSQLDVAVDDAQERLTRFREKISAS